MSDHLLSTKDNPYNPHTEFDDWYAWDSSHGYNTLSLLGRMTVTSDELSLQLQDQAIEEAIDLIVEENFSGMHIKVERPTES